MKSSSYGNDFENTVGLAVILLINVAFGTLNIITSLGNPESIMKILNVSPTII